MSVGARDKQTGAALIEFSFVLLPLLLLTLGILLYGLVFVSQQALAFSAQRGADALVQVDPASPPFRRADGSVNLEELCTSPVATDLAERRIGRILPNVGLLNGFSVTPGFRTDPQPGCTVTVEKDFPLAIPLLPLPERLRGVGFVPVS